MPTAYQKLENIVSKKYISDNLIVRHAYSRNVDPAYSPECYNLMKNIKKTLDPHMILSRGKFNF